MKKSKEALLMVLDAVLLVLSMLLAVQLYFDMHAPEAHILHVWRIAPVLAIASVLALRFLGFYRTNFQYAGIDTLIQIISGCMIGTIFSYLFSFAFYHLYREANIFLMPRPVYLIQGMLIVFMLGLSRFSIRLTSMAGTEGLFHSKRHEHRIMVVGAGWAGANVIREIQAGRYGDSEVVVAVDDDQTRTSTTLMHVPVVAGTDRVKEYAEKYKINEIIIAIATPKSDLSPLVQDCTETGCKVRVYSNPLGGTGTVRDVNIGDLLGRPETHLDMTEVAEQFEDRVVLVTGGGGSIGSELCRQIMTFAPKKLILFDISENYMYDLFFELKEKYGELVKNTVAIRVGSVRDQDTLDQVFAEFHPEIVIHAAAHKHVPLMEDSPEQAIKNNVFGTYNVASAAAKYKVKRFVMISTDKAVNPTNVMGASKRMAEIIVEAMEKKEKDTSYTAVRFGNVLGSNGSVVPIFEKQIKAGGPVTLTHPDIVRYFMTIPEAASLVLQAASIAKGGELFVLDMGKPVKIKELAERMIQLYGRDKNIPIMYTGLRPGEKMYEELLRTEENSTATSKEKIFIAKPEQVDWNQAETMMEELRKCLETNGDIKECMHRLLPSFRTPEEVNNSAR